MLFVVCRLVCLGCTCVLCIVRRVLSYSSIFVVVVVVCSVLFVGCALDECVVRRVCCLLSIVWCSLFVLRLSFGVRCCFCVARRLLMAVRSSCLLSDVRCVCLCVCCLSCVVCCL